MNQERPNLVVASLLAWLIPGAGHAFGLGMRAKGALYFVLVMGLFVTGLVVSDFHAVRLERHPIYFAAYAFAGLPTLVTMLATASRQVTEFLPEALGTLYCATAALLNLLCVLDVWAAAARQRAAESAQPSAGGAAS